MRVSMCLLKKNQKILKGCFPKLAHQQERLTTRSECLLQSYQDLRSSDIKLVQLNQLFSTEKMSSCS